ncbi:MAG TPA: hypothetical protein PKH43_05420 [Saprospiraceae bacterium]|nr:hypothetical protein [Saprospiraceae bacterium]
MKKILYLLALLTALLPASRTDAQNLVCNDFVSIAVNPDCQFTILPEHILEGTIFPDCVVELDKVAPFGNHSRTLVAPMPQAMMPTGTFSFSTTASANGGMKLPPPPLAPGCGSSAMRHALLSNDATRCVFVVCFSAP